MNPAAVDQYRKALREGRKYYRDAIARGEYPYPPALDDILHESAVAGYADLGLVNIPSDRIAGTKTAGRVAALAGNFMPILEEETEFASKWMNLCDAHLGDEGIRDPVRCYEYMGRFYIQEGNKRVSVLLSYEAPDIPAVVTRVVPQYTDEHEIKVYYEFMHFYSLSGEYNVEFIHRGQYAKLQAALGFSEEHVWTDDERRSFRAGFSRFREAFKKLRSETLAVTCAEALLVWLQVYTFAELKELSAAELTQKLSGIWPDVEACADKHAIELSTAPETREQGILSKILGIGRTDHISVAFIYAFSPEVSAWTQAHDDGRQYLESAMGDHVDIKVYTALDHDYDAAINEAIENGAELIFATTPSMIGPCRRAAARYPKVKILDCGLFQPYTGVRMYYSRIYECKFITGAIAGAMTENDTVGYVANYPIYGVPTGVNAFALGVRLTNPRARVKLAWSCVPGNPVQTLMDAGATVISNREAVSPDSPRNPFEIGTYLRRTDGTLQPLATPIWKWGRLYERVVQSILTGVWEDISASKALNYWWGMDSGVLDVHFAPGLPDGVYSLGRMLKMGVTARSVLPFQTRIVDRDGTLRNDGTRDFTPEELIKMDWFCENVEGSIPGFEELRLGSRDLVRTQGLYRKYLLPEIGGKQL